MSEQSSTVAMFRALVMLVCVVAIPLAALFGSSLPTVVKAIQEGRWPTLAEIRGTKSTPPAANEAPRFGPTTAQPASATATLAIPGQPPANSPSFGQRWPSSPAPTPPSPVVPAGYNAPLDNSRMATAQGGQSPPSLMPLPGGAPLMPIDAKPSEAAANGTATGQLSEAAPAGASEANDPYTQIQQRLRQLGATYYLLESWGDQKREYRFYCRMAIGGNAQYTRSFWAIDNDPLRAMGQVLQQVEAWRSGRS